MSSRNEHHGLPRSHGGSSHQTNITIVEEDRHNRWHSIVGHPTPDALLRYMLLVHATRLRPSLPPKVVADGLEILAPSNWERMYEPKALLTPTRAVDSQRNAVRHRIHRWAHMGQELRLTEQVVIALASSSEPSQTVGYTAADLQGFFQETCPAEMTRRILLEKDAENGEIAWSKPLTQTVRSNLLTVLKGAHAEPQTLEQQRGLLETVYGHLHEAEKMHNHLKPELQDLLDYQVWRQSVIENRKLKHQHRAECDQSHE